MWENLLSQIGKFSGWLQDTQKRVTKTRLTRVGFGMGYFRDPETRSRGFGIGIFYFVLDRKIGIGIRKSRKSQHPGIEIGILKPLKNPEKSRKTRNPVDEDWDFYPRDFRKIPRIPDFLPSGSGFFHWIGHSDIKPSLRLT